MKKPLPPEQLARYYCCYVTTHPSGFYYVGKGITRNVEAGKYKGSGVKLHAAFLTYPFDEWTSEVLCTFAHGQDGDDAAYAKERELVNWELLADPWCLNTHLGGKGSKYGQLTSKRLKIMAETMRGRKFSAEQRRKIQMRLKSKIYGSD